MLKKTAFLIFILFNIFVSQSQNIEIKKDTSGNVNIRIPSDTKKYLNDKTFLYDTKNAASPETFWQKVMYYLSQLFYYFFRFIEEGGILFKIVFYSLAALLLFFVILKLAGLSPHGLFVISKKAGKENLPVFDEDINSIDFDKIINDAVKNEDFGKAVRFLYIKFIKILSDNEIIEWKKEKTNREYKKEIKGKDISPDFNVLTEIYEYVWYGEYNLSKEKFYSVSGKFNDVFEKLNAKKRF